MASKDRDNQYRSLALTRQIEALRDGHVSLYELNVIISRKDVAISAKLEAIDIALSRGILTLTELENLPPRPQPEDFGVSTSAEADGNSHTDDRVMHFIILAAWAASTSITIWYLYDGQVTLGAFLAVLFAGLFLGLFPLVFLSLVTAAIVGVGGYLANRLVPSRIAKRRFEKALQKHSTLSLASEIKSHENDVTLYTKASGREFERLVARAYSKAGYEVVEVGGANDGGVDLIVSKAGIKSIVQCKAHARAISPAVVRELYGALTHSDAALAILASTNGPSDNARKWAEDKNILFVHPDDLILGRL